MRSTRTTRSICLGLAGVTALTGLALAARAARTNAQMNGAAATLADTAPATTSGASLPPVSPTPQRSRRVSDDLPVTSRVQIVVDDQTDAAARNLLVRLLRDSGATRVDVLAPTDAPAGGGLLTVRLGDAGRRDIRRALADTIVPTHAEGYALRASMSGSAKVVALGGVDPDGQFYAVQTLRQLLIGSPTQSSPTQSMMVAGAAISDFPSMPLRGTIEGFYGQPWSPDERLDQMDFYGDVKANTYIYAPKDDPYHRSKWRDPYPADKIIELGSLVRRATANHVRFTFAVSPGESICYSSPADRDALKAKLQAMYDLGVRAFSIPLDDIDYTRWNCPDDQTAYGVPGATGAARAQVDLLNDVQRNFIATHEGTLPLQMVPTEYGDLTDTTYKQTMRAALDPSVVVMWTGTHTVPPKITNEQADSASTLFGRKVFVWDNYPVNDFPNTSGRLLLAPYDKREAGLSEHLSGIVANPMNQPYASKVAIFGAADFAWNDNAYNASTSWPLAMSYLAGGDAAARDALLVFGDLEHLAPTFGNTHWQTPSPELKSRVSEFWAAWDGGDPPGAIAALRPYAVQIASAPAIIRGGSVQQGFATDAQPWLDATELWGRSMVATLDSLSAGLQRDSARAQELAATATALSQEASAVRVDPARNSWGNAAVKVGDEVLGTFIGKALDLARAPMSAGDRA